MMHILFLASTARAINPQLIRIFSPPVIELDETEVRDGTVDDSWPTGNHTRTGTRILELITP